jgi:SAM-dependent methyltransferase
MNQPRFLTKHLSTRGLLPLLYKSLNRWFPGSAQYWERRYSRGGNSGAGSYDQLAEFKAEILNTFVRENAISSVIDFGCGDGHQLSLAAYPMYVGLDVSETAIRNCITTFTHDHSKSFFLYDPLAFCDNASLFSADLSISLDVIYHLIEDPVFGAYMRHLFRSATRYVIIYSSNYDAEQTYHERDRLFTDWVDRHISGWSLVQQIPNKYKCQLTDPVRTSKADFYIYMKGSTQQSR